ncbi:glycosyltransferase family 2 protein [bacterium]|nr:glycosyltransferase family 2 protein [bacterium]
MSKKVSIIIPCYNQELYVEEAIESALNQTYGNIEIVCINDGSTDNSSSVISEITSEHKSIVFIDNKENKGVIASRNEAIKLASGEYILPLDADDKIEPTYVEKAVKILEENSDIGFVYCKANMFGDKNKYWKLPEFDEKTFIFANCIFCTALFRKSDFLKVGMYKEYMKYGCEDWDLWISFVENGLKPHRIDEVLFNYRQIAVSRSNVCWQNEQKWQRELIKNHLDLYLNNDLFLKLVFDNLQIKNSFLKYKKYKKLFNLILIFAGIELLLFVLLFVFVWRIQ